MRQFFIAACCVFISMSLTAQHNAKYEAYIEKYSDFAVECQKEHKIPASITLAQGLLESGAGQSSLARECNNHFGIKCGGKWYGRSMKLDDDRKDECFRCYKSAKESYDDHAQFLKQPRYAFLYQYKITDYKSWAYGLKKAGYATDPNYPTKLIKIIETYKLYEFDKLGGSKNGQTVKHEKEGKKEVLEADKLFDYIVIYNNGRRCIRLMGDDKFENIARAKGLSVQQLLYYNDLPEEVDLHYGDYVYLSRKKAQTKKTIPAHTVIAGESMHSIAQEYGITLKSLYKLNEIPYGTPAEVGQKIKLHK